MRAGGVIVLMVTGVIGIIAFQMVRGLAVSICVGVVGAEEVPASCELVGVGIGIVVIAGLFVMISVAAMGSSVWAFITGRNRRNPKMTIVHFARLADVLRAEMRVLDKTLGLEIVPIDGTEDNPVQLRLGKEKRLVISKEFKWYLVEKHPNHKMYKLVGLHDRRRGLNGVYVLGRDSHTGIPFLLRLPPNYLRVSLQHCINWCIRVGKKDIVKEV